LWPEKVLIQKLIYIHNNQSAKRPMESCTVSWRL